eukprot:207979_1
MLSLKLLSKRSGVYLNKSIHRSFSSAPLSQSDVDFFRNEGYLAIENFFNEDEFRAIRAGLIKLRNMGRLANVACEGDGITHTSVPKNLQLCPLSPELPIFKSLPFNTKIGSTMAKLLHDDNINEEQDICCYLSQTFWKPPQHGLGTGMHQDNAYFLFDRPHFGTAFWIPIHKATKENGTLKVVKGFAKAKDIENGTALEHIRDGTSDHHITCQDSIFKSHKDDIIDIELNEGGVAFFNNNVPHCTGSNETDFPRAAVAFHFINMKHFKERQFPLPQNVEYIAPIIHGPNCSNGKNEYGHIIGNKQWEKDMKNILNEENDILRQEKERQDIVARQVVQDRKTETI